MKTFPVVVFISLLLALQGAAAAPVPCAIFFEKVGAYNQVLIAWEGISNRLYQVQSSPDLSQPWKPLSTTPLFCPADWWLMIFPDLSGQAQTLYRVIDLGFVWIQPGTFIMGSPASEPGRLSEEGPLTEVTLTEGFWMAQHEVTQREYLELIGTNPSHINGHHGYPPPGVDFGTDLNRPVERVSWFQAVAYCEKLTERERRAGRLPWGYVYRLPTEAEWEYACRAGTTTPFHYGSDLRAGMATFDWRYEYEAAVGTVEQPDASWLEATTPVGSYPPNAWGLYDMHGNVWEWCWDWFSSAHPGGKAVDPTGPATGTDLALRGGCWNYRAVRLRSAHRRGHTPEFRSINLGFRLVLGKPLPPHGP